MRDYLMAGIAALALAGTAAHGQQAPAGHDMAAHAALQQAVDSPARSAADKARDTWRHPVETLGFFGVEPTDTVVELIPGGGWYTAILAPYLADHGKLYGAVAAGKGQDAFKAKIAANPGWAKVTAVDLPPAAAQVPDNSVDVVLTFRNIHNLVSGGDDAGVFVGAFRALKPGGTLGIVEHRLPEDQAGITEAESGYMKVSTVRRIAEAAGFRYVGASPVNANPKDDHNHPKGVWTLPPSYQLGDTDHAKYAAIGESDRMTLKFQKPTE